MPSPADALALDRTATLPPGAGAAASMPGAAGTLTEGARLGHFRVERPLGSGGMGEVYLATDLALDRPVAIKVLPGAVARDPARRDRLIREARAQARVAHPNVGHIYYIGEEHGLLYVAMEYVAGQTLAQAAAAAPLPVTDALVAIRGAALGLREAHRAGFLHRDVKPSNLMFDAHGVIKVLDFGLAASAPPGAERGGDRDRPLEQTSLAGTPLYMAPEQARGEPLDARADIYALGATLYHVASGAPPFEGGTADELREKHATAPRPSLPASVPARTAAALGALCARMMAPRREDRFGGYDELIAAIDTMAASNARPAGFWVRSMAAGADLMVAFIALLGIAVLCETVIGLKAPFENTLVLLMLCAYAAACTARYGRTAGKALLDLEVVDAATGARPRWRAALRRSAAMLGAPLVLTAAHEAVVVAGYSEWVCEVLSNTSYLVLLGLLAWAAARSYGKRAPWDRAAGTLVRYRVTR